MVGWGVCVCVCVHVCVCVRGWVGGVGVGGMGAGVLGEGGGGGLDEVCAVGHMQQRWQQRHSAITHDNLSTCHALTSRHDGWTGRAGLCLMFVDVHV